jgi:hypothetical protein
MSQSARVESVEALEAFKAALAKFGVTAQAALDTAAGEIQRTVAWLHDQLKHWQAEVRRREEDVGRAKADLVQKRWSPDKRAGKGATEQEIALKRAQQRLAEAQAKVEAVRRWQRLLPEALKEYEGPARQLAGMVGSDLRHSLAILDGKIAALEEYAAVQVAPGIAPLPSAVEASEAVTQAAAPEAPSSSPGIIEKGSA